MMSIFRRRSGNKDRGFGVLLGLATGKVLVHREATGERRARRRKKKGQGPLHRRREGLQTVGNGAVDGSLWWQRLRKMVGCGAQVDAEKEVQRLELGFYREGKGGKRRSRRWARTIDGRGGFDLNSGEGSNQKRN
jgi:hypothetical protein